MISELSGRLLITAKRFEQQHGSSSPVRLFAVQGGIFYRRSIMRHVIGLLWAVNFTVVAVALLYFKKAGTVPFVALLAAGLIGGYFIHRADLWIKKLGVAQTADGLSLQLEAAQNEIEAAKNEALAELNKRVTVHEEALSGIIERAKKTREDLEKVAEAAAPPTLSLESKSEVRKDRDGYTVDLHFVPSKNVPFGKLTFQGEIVEGTEAIFKKFDPGGGTQTFGEHIVAHDGKKVTDEYWPHEVSLQTLTVTVSAPCRVRICGSHMAEPLELDIE